MSHCLRINLYGLGMLSTVLNANDLSYMKVDRSVPHNKAVQTDNLRAVRLVVSLSFHFTTRRTAHKLRLTAALGEIWKNRAA